MRERYISYTGQSISSCERVRRGWRYLKIVNQKDGSEHMVVGKILTLICNLPQTAQSSAVELSRLDGERRSCTQLISHVGIGYGSYGKPQNGLRRCADIEILHVGHVSVGNLFVIGI